MKERTAHIPEFPDFFTKIILRHIKAACEARKAQKTDGTAIDHLFCEGNLVRFKRTAALNTGRQGTAGLTVFRRHVMHETLPDGTDTAAYHGPGRAD